MASFGLPGVLETYSFVIHILLYIAIFIFLIRLKGAIAKLHLIIVVIGFFGIVHFVDFYRAQFFILAWLAVNNIPMLIDRTVAIVLIVILALFLVFMPMFYYPVSLAVYTLIIFGFLHAAYLPRQK